MPETEQTAADKLAELIKANKNSDDPIVKRNVTLAISALQHGVATWIIAAINRLQEHKV